MSAVEAPSVGDPRTQRPPLGAARLLSRLETFLLATAFLLWMLPVGFGMRLNVGLRTAVAVPLAVACLIHMRNFRGGAGRGRIGMGATLVGLFTLSWGIAFIRTAAPGLTPGALNLQALFVVGFLAFLLAYIACLSVAASDRGADAAARSSAQIAALLALGVYVTTSVVVYLVGFRQTDDIYLGQYPAQLLSLIGVHRYRALFPFSEGISWFGLVAGGAFVMAVPLLAPPAAPKLRWVAALVAGSSIIGLVATDSRGALLCAGGAVLLGAVPGSVGRYLRWVPLLASFLPIAIMSTYPSAFGGLEGLNREAGRMDPIARRDLIEELCAGEDPPRAPLSNRPLIWAAALEDLAQAKPVHIVGYGFRGQVTSGLSAKWACVFLSYSPRRLTTAHNLWLQTVLSIGYLGAGVTVALCIWLVLHLGRQTSARRDPGLRGMLWGVQYVLLAGMLESTLYPDNGTFFLFLVAAVLAARTADART